MQDKIFLNKNILVIFGLTGEYEFVMMIFLKFKPNILTFVWSSQLHFTESQSV